MSPRPRNSNGCTRPACTASTRRRRTKNSRRCADSSSTLGISLPPGNQVHPRDFDRVLRRYAGTPESQLISEVMLRSQSQAAYSPDNIGHFGLALPRYAHFTSPIRRYADLLVHRAPDQGPAARARRPARRSGRGISRKSATASPRPNGGRSRPNAMPIDRYLTAFMADRIGGRFAARISGVTRFGLFVTVTETGASGIVPFATLPDDYWQYDEREQTLTGRRTQKVYRLAQEVEVLLSEANPVTGGMVFHVLRSGPRRRGAGGTLHRGNGPAAGDPDQCPSGAVRHRTGAGRSPGGRRVRPGSPDRGLYRCADLHRAADPRPGSGAAADASGACRA